MAIQYGHINNLNVHLNLLDDLDEHGMLCTKQLCLYLTGNLGKESLCITFSKSSSLFPWIVLSINLDLFSSEE